MNTERPLIRPFKNLDDLEKIVSGIQIKIFPNSDPVKILNGGSYRCEFSELRTLGVTILLNTEIAAITAAIAKIGISAEEVKVVAVVDSSFLRNRKVFELGSISNLGTSYDLATKGAHRDEVLMDRRHGFDVYVQFVLVNDLQPKPLTPYRKGTELARAKFSVNPLPDGDGLSPQPLDSVNRTRLKLPSTTELFIEVDSPLLEMDTFEGNLVIWMNEEIFNLCLSQKSNISEQYLEAAAINALVQIVYLLSAELQNVEIDKIEDKPPMVLNVLEEHFKAQNVKTLLGESSFVSVLKSSPEKIAAVLSGFGKNIEHWKLILDNED